MCSAIFSAALEEEHVGDAGPESEILHLASLQATYRGADDKTMGFPEGKVDDL